MNLVEREMIANANTAKCAANESLDCLLRAAAHIRQKRVELLEQFALTEARYSVLAALKVAALEGLSQSELAERLLQSESNISTLVERMQQEGLVDRLRSDADRRKRVLQLSPSGVRLLDRVEAAKRNWATRMVRIVPADDRSTLALLMRQLVEGLEGHRSDSAATSAVGTLSVTSLHEAAPSHEESSWIDCHGSAGDELNSPHLALRQMLSTLGLHHQNLEDEA